MTADSMVRRVLRRLALGLLWALVALFLVVVVTLGAFAWLAGQRETKTAAEIAPRSGRFVRAGDVDVFLQQTGAESGPLVLFVHGTGAWSETWRGSLDAVAAAGFRGVAIDLPPFGHSERPAEPRYSKADQARRIVGVLDGLGVRRAILAGHSFGGGPTVEAALRAPDRVRGLVLVDAALGIRADGAPPAAPSALVRSVLAVSPVRDALVAGFLTNPRFTRRLLAAFVADETAASPERVAVYQRPLVIRGTTRAVGSWLPELVAPAAPARSEDPAAYRTLAMPLTAIWGARDTVTPLAQGERLVALAPGATLEVLASAGHIPQIEAPREFDERLVKALQAMHRAAEP
jgi:pimeloyl-ACP methyl ester carboxylesterase